MGFLVKLDTNGYRPDVLREAIFSGCVDYVAMDIKNCPDMYGVTVGIENFDVAPILESVNILKENKVPYEFRTTVLKGLHTEESFSKIGEWLSGVERYFLQSFKDSGDLISTKFVGYDEKEMLTLLNVLNKYIPNAQIRG